MREHGRFFVCAAIMLALMWLAGCEGNGRVAVMTNEATNKAELRVGAALNETWEVGALGQYFTTDLDGKDFGTGGYVKMSVDPNATIAVSDWVGGLGEMLNLPESMTVETYGIGKLLYADNADDDPLGAAIGAGFEIGPIAAELLYEVVEGGDVSNPDSSSGLELWFGAGIPF